MVVCIMKVRSVLKLIPKGTVVKVYQDFKSESKDIQCQSKLIQYADVFTILHSSHICLDGEVKKLCQESGIITLFYSIKC